MRQHLGARMKPGNMIDHVAQQIGAEHVLGGHRIENAILREAPHHNDPVDNTAFVAPRDAATLCDGQRTGLKIELRSSAPIEADLSRARRASHRLVREIEIWQSDRPLQLIGVVTSQEHFRNMRIDDLDPADIRPIGAGIAQKSNDLPLTI